jgi:hypothetical protein
VRAEHESAPAWLALLQHEERATAADGGAAAARSKTPVSLFRLYELATRCAAPVLRTHAHARIAQLCMFSVVAVAAHTHVPLARIRLRG